ncbi:MAG: hypothetical protein ACJ73D_00355 [Pyrinomonadaceae bacterium]
MAMNQDAFEWRRYDRRLFAAVALVFPLAVLVGFARTYYLKLAFGTAPLPSLLVHAHGALMTTWVAFFIAQVWLIRSRNHRTHMKFGMFGIALAVVMIFVGFFTGVAAAKYGSASTPAGIPPLAFLAVPLFDILMFALLFGAAIYYRMRPAEHKRLMLLTAINFLPPAVGRFPFEPFSSGGPLMFFGVPALIMVVLLVLDTWRNGQLNKVFLAGSILLIASYPLRLMLAGTGLWAAFAAWLTGWAA